MDSFVSADVECILFSSLFNFSDHLKSWLAECSMCDFLEGGRGGGVASPRRAHHRNVQKNFAQGILGIALNNLLQANKNLNYPFLIKK